MRMSKCFIAFLTLDYLDKISAHENNPCKFEFTKALELFGLSRMVFVNIEQTRRSIDELLKTTFVNIDRTRSSIDDLLKRPFHYPSYHNAVSRTTRGIRNPMPVYIDLRTAKLSKKNFRTLVKYIREAHQGRNREALEEWEQEAYVAREDTRVPSRESFGSFKSNLTRTSSIMD